MKRLKPNRYWILAVPILLFIVLQLYFLLHILWWAHFNPSSTSFMREQLAVIQAKNPKARLKYQWTDALSPHLKRAAIASEDTRFADHHGVSWNEMWMAYQKNTKKGKIVAGGSTITQQLAKNLFLSGQKSYLRKMQELLITYMIEAVMSKERILTIYLNVVEFGRGIFGAEAAARHYFGISAKALSPEQAARLIVLLPNPRRYGTNLYSSYLNWRTNIVLRRMPQVALPKKNIRSK